MVKGANPSLLWAAVLVFPITFFITSYRWNLLLSVLEIRMRQGRTFVLNMVGCFYNTFMPGSTGETCSRRGTRPSRRLIARGPS